MTDTYEAHRARQAAQHDPGAGEALMDAADMTVNCSSYCYGGSAKLDLQETLADLAEQGWRLVRVDTSITMSAPATSDATSATSTDTRVTVSAATSTTPSIGTSTSDSGRGRSDTSPHADLTRLATLPDDYWK